MTNKREKKEENNDALCRNNSLIKDELTKQIYTNITLFFCVPEI